MPVIVLNIILAVTYLVLTRKIHQVLFFELIFFVSFYLKTIKDYPKPVVADGDEVIIRGVFRVFRTNKSNIASIQYKKDMLAKIMDWDLLVVNMGSKITTIYVPQSRL